MPLQIKNNQGIFEINGNIIAENVYSLKHHFEQLLVQSERIIISLDHVKKIDAYGVQVLTKLHKMAMKSNKILSIIGKENKTIKKAFGNFSYVLSSDFV